MIRGDNLWVRVEEKTLLAGVSLTIAPGEVVAIVGPNGAGKSTLLRVLCGELRPAEGEVWMNGRPLSAWPRRERAQIRAVLPQDSTLNFPFLALEVVLMGRLPHIRSTESPRDYAIARAALTEVGLEHLEHRLYPTLSGGGTPTGPTGPGAGANMGIFSTGWALSIPRRANYQPRFGLST